jgi:hypothetical protein
MNVFRFSNYPTGNRPVRRIQTPQARSWYITHLTAECESCMAERAVFLRENLFKHPLKAATPELPTAAAA